MKSFSALLLVVVSCIFFLAFVQGQQQQQSVSSSPLVTKWTLSRNFGCLKSCVADNGATFFAVDANASIIYRISSSTGQAVSSTRIHWTTTPTPYPSDKPFIDQQQSAATAGSAIATVAVRYANVVAAFTFAPANTRTASPLVQTLSIVSNANYGGTVPSIKLTSSQLNTLVIPTLNDQSITVLRSYSVTQSSVSSPVETFQSIIIECASNEDCTNGGFYESNRNTGGANYQNVLLWLDGKDKEFPPVIAAGYDIATGIIL